MKKTQELELIIESWEKRFDIKLSIIQRSNLIQEIKGVFALK